MTTAAPLAGTYAADTTHSSFQFGLTFMKTSTYRAAFDDAGASLAVTDDGMQLEGAARVASVTISEPRFREHLVRGADFFDADNHPEIVFRSTSVEVDANGATTVAGELSMRGVTKPVTATGSCEGPVEDPFGHTRISLQLTAVIDRRDWGLDWQAPLPKGGEMLGWDVELTIALSLVRDEG